MKININDLDITVEKGKTVLEAALENGIFIPHLCYHPDLDPAGACRLCLVETGAGKITIACKTPVEEGMCIKTSTPEIERFRKTNLEMLIASHPEECLRCPKDGDCRLQEMAAFCGVDKENIKKLRKTAKNLLPDTSNPFFTRDHNLCILCGICVRTCNEIQGANAIDFAFRGSDTKISTLMDKPILDSKCEACGECVVRCPVGALSVTGANNKPEREVKTICTFCGCGCGLFLGVRGNKVVSARGDKDSPVNRGRLCVKGRFGFEFINSPERLTKPLLRKRDGFEEISWEKALDIVAEKLSAVSGTEFSMLSSARCTNEDIYLSQKFARAVMKTNNVEHCARLCHAASVVGLQKIIGSGAATNTFSEIENTKCILAVGTNTTEAHPIAGLAVKAARRKGARLIVIDPRRTQLAGMADIWLKPRYGTDVPLFMAMCKVVLERGLTDREFIEKRTEGFEAFRESLKDFSVGDVSKLTGIPESEIIRAAVTYAENKPGCVLWGMGVTEHTHGVDNVIAVTSLVLLCGNIGKPSSGVNPLRGQNNVQGACDMGALYNVYPGYQPVQDEKMKEKFETAWGTELSLVPGTPLTLVWDKVLSGEIKVLYLFGIDPVITVSDSGKVRRALKKAEFVISQDIFMTETAKFADIILPAASFAEKDGTFTNAERRVQRVRKALDPPGEARPDWEILCQVAQRMKAKGFNFKHPSEILAEIAFLTPSYGGLTYDRLEKNGIQWPCLDCAHPGTPILHIDKFKTVSGKGHFTVLKYRPPEELPDKQFPFLLTTDRPLYHYHAAMTSKVEGLNRISGEEYAEINPLDAGKLRIKSGDRIEVSSRRGKVVARAKVTDCVGPGTVSMSFHFSACPTNIITSASLDPDSKTPEYKVCAIRIKRVKTGAKI